MVQAKTRVKIQIWYYTLYIDISSVQKIESTHFLEFDTTNIRNLENKQIIIF